MATQHPPTTTEGCVTDSAAVLSAKIISLKRKLGKAKSALEIYGNKDFWGCVEGDDLEDKPYHHLTAVAEGKNGWDFAQQALEEL